MGLFNGINYLRDGYRLHGAFNCRTYIKKFLKIDAKCFWFNDGDWKLVSGNFMILIK